jgi:hypothetical protein
MVLHIGVETTPRTVDEMWASALPAGDARRDTVHAASVVPARDTYAVVFLAAEPHRRLAMASGRSVAG